MRSWCHNINNAVVDLSGSLAGNDAELLRVEDLGYKFAQLVINNLSKIDIEQPTSSELIYYASLLDLPKRIVHVARSVALAVRDLERIAEILVRRRGARLFVVLR